jgi:hypothetical protein
MKMAAQQFPSTTILNSLGSYWSKCVMCFDYEKLSKTL